MKLVVKYSLTMTLTSAVGIHVCHNDQPLCYGTRGDNRQRNAGGNRVIRTKRSYRRAILLPRCWLRIYFLGNNLERV